MEENNKHSFFFRELYDWFFEHHDPEHDDLSVWDMLFLVVAHKRADGGNLLYVFDNFQAKADGSVEMDINSNSPEIN